ncbi:MAG: NAD(P)-binding protein, partial [Saprospiraceae bacterium]
MKSIIIGAGIGGIATAIRLSTLENHQVEVFETNSFPGGKLSQFELSNFRFDAGPSLFTMPHYVDELFEICGENPNDSFSYL